MAAPDPVRIMIIGDSVAQGSSGDWTWRYRLWQTLTSSGVPFDLVGPHDDLFDVATELRSFRRSEEQRRLVRRAGRLRRNADRLDR